MCLSCIVLFGFMTTKLNKYYLLLLLHYVCHFTILLFEPGHDAVLL